jgi:hypothetical protein
VPFEGKKKGKSFPLERELSFYINNGRLLLRKFEDVEIIGILGVCDNVL